MLRIAVERKKLKLSQSELARRAMMHVSSLSGIECGRLKAWPGQAEKLHGALIDSGWSGEGDLFAEVDQ